MKFFLSNEGKGKENRHCAEAQVGLYIPCLSLNWGKGSIF